MPIPNILHFTWKTEDVPGRMGEYLARWRQTHAHWQIILWTDASMRAFVAEHYPDFLSRYDAYPHPIQRADSFRYLVLRQMGGVYADLDVEPLRQLDPLVEDLTCFAGIEPDEHMGADRKHSGTPYLVSNAFMGAEPGHPWFGQLVDLLPQVSGISDIFLSTGPALTTAAAARLPRPQRPVLIPPCLWSPLCDGGKPCRSDARLEALLSPAFDFVWADRKPFVSHHWLTSWVPWDKRHKWLAKPFHALHALKWAARAARNPKLAGFNAPDPGQPYFDQLPKKPRTWPEVMICLSLLDSNRLSDELVKSLGRLDYPKDRIAILVGATERNWDSAEVDDACERLRAAGLANVRALIADAPVTASGPHMQHARTRAMAASAHLRNAMAAEARLLSTHSLFISNEIGDLPISALKDALAAPFPIVAMALRNAEGREADSSVYRYHWGGGIRVAYKIVSKDGVAGDLGGQRDRLSNHRAFRYLPLDGVGTGFLLVDNRVFEAGVGFAETPYQLHLDGEGFALAARTAGFEVAGLTESTVSLRTDTAPQGENADPRNGVRRLSGSRTRA